MLYSIGENKILMELKMARKQITTLYLERQAHRDAKKRLSLAYAYLIEASQGANEQTDKKEKMQLLTEVKP